jgi:hypothetical protein
MQYHYSFYWFILLLHWTTYSLVAQDYGASLAYSRPKKSVQHYDQNSVSVFAKTQEQNKNNIIQAKLVMTWETGTVLLRRASYQIEEEIGLDSMASIVSRIMGKSAVIDSTWNVKHIIIPLPQRLEMDIVIPIKIISSEKFRRIPVVIPSSLSSDSVKCKGAIDSLYQINVLALHTDRPEPIKVGHNRYEQRLLIMTHIIDPLIIVDVTPSMMIRAALRKYGHGKYSVGFELVIESHYDEVNNRFEVQFSNINRKVISYHARQDKMNVKMTIPQSRPIQLNLY